MSYYNKNKQKLKVCPKSGQPIMKSWGIGEGRLPLTDDPENPIKMFADYEVDTDQDTNRK